MMTSESKGNYLTAAKEAGVEGLIVPNLPYAATYAFRSEAMKNNLELVDPFTIHRFFIPILPSCNRDAETETKEASLTDLNNGCMQVLLTTPTTPEERMKEITRASEGFIYLVCACYPHIKPQLVYLKV